MTEVSELLEFEFVGKTREALADALVDGEEAFTARYGKRPNRLSVPVTVLPLWLEVIGECLAMMAASASPFDRDVSYNGIEVCFHTRRPAKGFETLVFSHAVKGTDGLPSRAHGGEHCDGDAWGMAERGLERP